VLFDIIDELLRAHKNNIPYENIINIVKMWYELLENIYDQSATSYFSFLLKDIQLIETRCLIYLQSPRKNNEINFEKIDDDDKDYCIDNYQVCVGNFITDVSRWYKNIMPFNLTKAKRQIFYAIKTVGKQFILSPVDSLPELTANDLRSSEANYETKKITNEISDNMVYLKGLEQNLVAEIKNLKIIELKNLNKLKSKTELIRSDFYNITNNIEDINIKKILTLIDSLMFQSLYDYQTAAIFKMLSDILFSSYYKNILDELKLSLNFFFGGFVNLLKHELLNCLKI
jgi:hypothetical protein